MVLALPLHTGLPRPCPRLGIYPIHDSVVCSDTIDQLSPTTWGKDLFIQKQVSLIMLHKICILKHDLKSFSDCPASPKRCCFFPAVIRYPLHLGLGDFYIFSFPVSSILQPLTFIASICYHSHFSKKLSNFLKEETVSLMSASCIAYAVLPIRPHMDNRYSKNIHWVYECRVNSWGQHDTIKFIYLKGTELLVINTKYIWYSLVVYFLIILSCCFFPSVYLILTYSEWYS